MSDLKPETQTKLKEILGERFSSARSHAVTVMIYMESTRGIGLSFADMSAVSELLGTKLIDVGAEESYGGSETCDYGRVYTAVLTCRECNL